MPQAVILAAGEGQRLRPLTAERPKVMLPVANRPILQYVIEALAECGIREIVMVVGYRKEEVMRYFGDGREFGVKIEYVFQHPQLGTGHALMQAKDKVGESFFVLPGDNVIEARTLLPLLDLRPPAVLLKEGPPSSKYGIAVIEGGRLVELVEKPSLPPSPFVNTGIYLLSSSIFDLLREELDLPAAISRLCREREVRAACTAGLWEDAVYPWDLLRLNFEALKSTKHSLGGLIEPGVVIRGRVKVGEGTRIRAGTYILGPAVVGRRCEIGPHSCIFPATSIGDDVRIGPFSEIRNSIIEEGAEIGTGSAIEDSFVGRGARLRARFSAPSGEADVEVEGERHRIRMGAVVGEGSRIGENTTVLPGVRIGKGAEIRGLRIIEKDIPDEALVL